MAGEVPRTVRIHPHAADRLAERGATESEAIDTVLSGERFEAKFGRVGFRRNFSYNGPWRNRIYATKQVEVIAASDGDGWLVVTVLVKFF